ncbi:winged helix-turn-helix transcriptional regulator [Candidatus Pacearchaeota archaeon]|nr:hypothetical protein [uncultured archaeon]MBS3072801.1 winged helix-turn-helix transcriptional regulator [Candidatus Pacearchaeota archaeon]
MSKKYIMLELDDEKLKVLTDVLSNKTSKKILEYLADKEASEGEISSDLKLPANTVNYNVKKLLEAGLVEGSKNWMWSVKGKKIIKYKVANKKIIISPKSSGSVNKILGAFIATGAFALIIKLFGLTQNTNIDPYATDYGMEAAKSASDSVSIGVGSGNVGSEVIQAVSVQSSNIWVWFLFGGIVALVIFMILNWRKLD